MADLAPLGAHWDRLEERHLRELFAEDPERFTRFSRSFGDLTIDFSKERIDEPALDALLALAETAGVAERRAAMFAGDPINLTEGRAVLHAALRATAADGLSVDGAPTAPLVDTVLDAFLAFADRVRSGEIKGSGGAFTDIVNIGIGGSDLGPVMAARALSPYMKGAPRLHFVSNVDGAHLADVVDGLDPARTLVIVASKTFTTLETMANATAAKAWLHGALGGAADDHLAALSTNLDATAAFGIPEDRVFGFWDWVGGRYSVWSSIGLSVAIGIGLRAFPRLPRRRTRHGPALPGGAAVQKPPRASRPCRDLAAERHGLSDRGAHPLRPAARTFSGLCPATRHGIEREIRDAGRGRGPERHGPGHLGRAGHQCPALLLPACASGNGCDPRRLHPLREFRIGA